MAGKPVPIPTTDLQDKILCIEDLRQAALKKLPKGILGTASLNHGESSMEQINLVQANLRRDQNSSTPAQLTKSPYMRIHQPTASTGSAAVF